MLEWPGELPPPLWDFEAEYISGMKGSGSEIFPIRNRLHTGKKLSVNFIFNQDQLRDFCNFEYQNGPAYFKAPWVDSAGYPNHLCRFVGSSSMIVLKKGLYKVSATMELILFNDPSKKTQVTTDVLVCINAHFGQAGDQVYCEAGQEVFSTLPQKVSVHNIDGIPFFHFGSNPANVLVVAPPFKRQFDSLEGYTVEWISEHTSHNNEFLMGIGWDDKKGYNALDEKGVFACYVRGLAYVPRNNYSKRIGIYYREKDNIPPEAKYLHWAFVRSGEVIRLFVNGKKIREEIIKGLKTYSPTDAPMIIGCHKPPPAWAYEMKTKFASFRWTTKPRWSNDFTPPSYPLTVDM